MVYAIKAVDGQEINRIETCWEVCKALVLGKNAVYHACKDETEAREYLQETSIKNCEELENNRKIDMAARLIYARFLYYRFKNPSDTGYSVGIYKTKYGKVACKGYMLPDNERMEYAMSGEFVKDSKYGTQFLVSSYKERVTDTKDGIIAFLSCGVLKGIGPKRAEAIYEKFGSNTMEVFENHPQELLKVKGINKAKLKTILEDYEETKYSRKIISYLLSFGLSQKYGMLLYKKYGAFAVDEIQKNPYILCRIKGITFMDSDRIAKSENYPMDARNRIEAAANYVIYSNEQSGSTGMELQAFGNALYDILDTDTVTKGSLNESVCEMVKEHLFKVVWLEEKGEKKQYIFPKATVNREYDLAKDLVCFNRKTNCLHIESQLKEIEDKDAIALDVLQKDAILRAMENHLSLAVGGPGTGKTTLICYAIKLYETLFPGKNIVLMAPTGRAARRMEEVTGHTAHTLYSKLHISNDNLHGEDDVWIKNALVIVDEFSMADMEASAALFSSVDPETCNLLLVGDIHQLPSVGPGAVLRDIVYSELFQVTWLERIFRTDENSKIYENANKVRLGETSIEEGSDFHMTECTSMEDVRNLVVEKYLKGVKTYGLMHVMCMCPYWEYRGGIYDLNAMIQEQINPARPNELQYERKNTIFRPRDLVMHTKINLDEVSNGDIGTVTDIVKEDDIYTITVQINNQEIAYEGEDISLLELAYVTSIHKAQGGEADLAIFTLMPMHKNMLYYNIPYVAMSRGKKQVEFCGSRDAIETAIRNREMDYRQTLLKYYLDYLGGHFVQLRE